MIFNYILFKISLLSHWCFLFIKKYLYYNIDHFLYLQNYFQPLIMDANVDDISWMYKIRISYHTFLNNCHTLFTTNERKYKIKVFVSRAWHQWKHIMDFSFIIHPEKWKERINDKTYFLLDVQTKTFQFNNIPQVSFKHFLKKY